MARFMGSTSLNPKNYPASPEVMELYGDSIDKLDVTKILWLQEVIANPSSRLGANSASTHVQGTTADILIPGQSHLETANQASESGLFGG